MFAKELDSSSRVRGLEHLPVDGEIEHVSQKPHEMIRSIAPVFRTDFRVETLDIFPIQIRKLTSPPCSWNVPCEQALILLPTSFLLVYARVLAHITFR